MASSTKKQKVQDSKCSREFQTWWAEKYGIINKGDKAVCVLCSGTVVCRTSSVKRHFETNHKSFCEKSEPEQKEIISSAIKDRKKQSTSMFKYVSKNCHTSVASYSAANAIARHDICQHFNELNIKLQGPNETVIVMMDLIRAFGAKLYVFRNDIITKNYKYFPNLKKNIKDLDVQEKRNEEKVIDDFFKELSET
ncbi:general transcription factor II-I repeat domain-containing protein 2A [Trichonephila clavipes]|nr:general transcription factor II-I repeat domain-containing protein 2A [Trichonephila clavipes]